MIKAREIKVESRFAGKAARGRGVGIGEAVAAAEASVEVMRGDVMKKIAVMVGAAQASRPAIAARDPAAFAALHETADALVGLCAHFSLPELGQTAFSLCQLFDASKPGAPGPRAVAVHLDAMQLFWSLPPEERAACAPEVLDGLKRVAAFPARRAEGALPPRPFPAHGAEGA